MKKIILLLIMMLITSTSASNVYGSYDTFQMRTLNSKVSIGGGYSAASHPAWFVVGATVNKQFGVGILMGRYNKECPTFNPFIRDNTPSTLEPVYCPNGVYAGMPLYYRPHHNIAIGATALLKFHNGITVQFNQEIGRFQEVDVDNSVYVHPYISVTYIDGIFGFEIGALPREPMITGLIHLYL